MWWRRNRRDGPLATQDSVRDLRAQLIAARDKVQYQIETQNCVRYSRGGGYGGDDLAVRVLQSELDEIEQSLASLGPGDA